MIEEIAIKAGFVYQGKQFEQLDKKVYEDTLARIQAQHFDVRKLELTPQVTAK